jgi:hypothetical protein
MTRVDSFNHHRLLEPIGRVPLAEFDAGAHRPSHGFAIAT